MGEWDLGLRLYKVVGLSGQQKGSRDAVSSPVGSAGCCPHLLHHKLSTRRQKGFATRLEDGKRLSSERKESLAKLPLQCPRCGTGNRGICYGPSICCSGVSCLLNESLMTCRIESLRARPCQLPGKACGQQGRCAPVRGFCCRSGQAFGKRSACQLAFPYLSDGCKQDASCDEPWDDEYSLTKR